MARVDEGTGLSIKSVVEEGSGGIVGSRVADGTGEGVFSISMGSEVGVADAHPANKLNNKNIVIIRAKIVMIIPFHSEVTGL